MFTIVLGASLLLTSFGFYNQDNVPAPNEHTDKITQEMVGEFDDLDLEIVLKDQEVKRRVVKGKPRFKYTAPKLSEVN